MKYHVSIDSESYEMEISESNGHTVVRVDGEEVEVDFRRVRGSRSYSLLLGHSSYSLAFEPRPDGLSITVAGEAYLAHVEDERTRAARSVRSGGEARDAAKVLLSMMPGIVRDVRVAVGQSVTAGEPLLILEAMKMENEIRAVADGVVKQVHVKSETTVNKGDPLVTLE